MSFSNRRQHTEDTRRFQPQPPPSPFISRKHLKRWRKRSGAVVRVNPCIPADAGARDLLAISTEIVGFQFCVPASSISEPYPGLRKVRRKSFPNDTAALSPETRQEAGWSTSGTGQREWGQGLARISRLNIRVGRTPTNTALHRRLNPVDLSKVPLRPRRRMGGKCHCVGPPHVAAGKVRGWRLVLRVRMEIQAVRVHLGSREEKETLGFHLEQHQMERNTPPNFTTQQFSCISVNWVTFIFSVQQRSPVADVSLNRKCSVLPTIEKGSAGPAHHSETQSGPQPGHPSAKSLMGAFLSLLFICVNEEKPLTVKQPVLSETRALKKDRKAIPVHLVTQESQGSEGQTEARVPKVILAGRCSKSSDAVLAKLAIRTKQTFQSAGRGGPKLHQ
ncbi:hypothetical protein JZ751_012331 [Albula glossodonta]|uniref:Uncharacterized protein n=1 Tax=Albula glossodonta TaxID=121402 RepID=A0A8T2PS22_9TELE|nr:hypothetical protein JZ751_012331 [Albula glossodonta]